MRAYDPAALGSARRIYPERDDLVLCASRDDALEGADALAVVTEWVEFRNPDFATIKRILRRPAIFDGRNLYDPPCSGRWASITFPSAGGGLTYRARCWPT